ncbi:MAG: hypothetical protein R3C19_25615 [Planctomycetaceae bacterium]
MPRDVPLAVTGGTGGPPNHMPPPVKKSATPPPPQETLTQKFNRAARPASNDAMPPSVYQIEILKKKLSRPSPNLSPTPVGNSPGNHDPDRDRKIMHEIKAIQAKLDQAKREKNVAQQFGLAASQGKAKVDFNRSAGLKM